MIPGNAATYEIVPGAQPTIAPLIPLPYRRPCRSLCTAISYLGTTCGGILEGLGVPVACAANDTSGFYALYSSDAAKCNALASSAGVQLVADSQETYVGTACAGITKQIYVPQSSMVDPTGALAPMLPPYVLQTMLEVKVSKIFSMIPRWFLEGCNTAVRTIMCPVTLQKAQPLESLHQFFGTVYMPSMPSHDLCQNFHQQCPLLVSMVPLLDINCSMVVGGIHAFPKGNQTITTVNLGIALVPLITSPNTLSDMDAGFVVPTQCPFAYSPNPEANLLHGIYPIVTTAGTRMSDHMGCGIECPFRIYSDADYNYMTNGILAAMVLVGSSNIIMLIQVCIVPYKKINIFIVFSAISNIVTYTFMMPMHLFSAHHWHGAGTRHSPQCSSATSWYSGSDVTDPVINAHGEASFCQGFAAVFRGNAIVALWVIMSIYGDLWFRIVWSARDLSKYRILYSYIPGLFILGLLLFPYFYGEDNTWNSQSNIFPVCSWATGHDGIDSYYDEYVEVVIFCVAMVTAAHCLYVCIVTTLATRNKNEKNPLLKIWKTYRVIFMYALTFMAIYPLLLIYTYAFLLGDKKKTATFNGINNWHTCLLGYFTNLDADPTGGVQQCGQFPYGPDGVSASEQVSEPPFTWQNPDRIFPRPSPPSLTLLSCSLPPPLSNAQLGFISVLIVQAVFQIFATSNNETKKFWWSFVPQVIQDSVCCFMCRDQIKVMPTTSQFFKDSTWLDRGSAAQTSAGQSTGRGESSGTAQSSAADPDSDSSDDELDSPSSAKITKKGGMGLVSADEARRMGQDVAAEAADLVEEGIADRPKEPAADKELAVDGESKEMH